MPLYEYQCDSCGHRFELIQKFSDPPAKECPRCGGTVQKLVSSPAFQFKGSGWYVTDYARKSETAKTESKGSGGESKETKDTSSSDGAKDSAKGSGSTTDSPPTPAPKSS
jgi:putative FmdB family regulatory protein